MNKAILVVDMPDKCYECACKKLSGMYNTHNFCGAAKRELKNDIFKSKPKWCPLKEVPEKRTLYHHFDEGWNKCIDKILNED